MIARALGVVARAVPSGGRWRGVVPRAAAGGLMRKRLRKLCGSTATCMPSVLPMVPAARLELARLAAADFESAIVSSTGAGYRAIASAKNRRNRAIVP